MRIAVVSDLYPPHFLGGYEIECRQHVEEFIKRGHEVNVLTSRWKVGNGVTDGNVFRLLHFSPFNKNLRLRVSPFDSIYGIDRLREIKWALECRLNYRIACNFLKRIKPEAAYIWNMGSVGIGPVIGAQHYGIPTVFRLNDYWLASLKENVWLKPNPLKRAYRGIIAGLRRFDRIDLTHMIMCSHSLLRIYADLGFAESNMSVIPSGLPSSLSIDNKKLKSLDEINRGNVRLMFAGRLVPEKGVDVGIKALKHLLERNNMPPLRLDIYGDGPEEYAKVLQDMVYTLELGDTVKFMGTLEPQQFIARYEDYHAFLFTSRWEEPFGLTLLTAMARGVPVIATKRGAAPEIICDGENGILVSADDPVALADAIHRLVQNPLLYEKMRNNALKTVHEKFTFEKIFDKIEAYFQMVLT
jgi:glycosyltransferase involved in cell wall biosynthesis